MPLPYPSDPALQPTAGTPGTNIRDELNALEAGGGTAVVVLTQAAYDALSPPVATTLYLIKSA